MVTTEIPKSQWRAFFDDLGKLHAGWQTTIEVLGRDLGDQHAVAGLPLQGFSYETRGSEATDILIEVGDTPDAYITHHVDRPRHVRLTQSQPGMEADIQIESTDGPVTLVSLRRHLELPPPRFEFRPAARARARMEADRTPVFLLMLGGMAAAFMVARLLGGSRASRGRQRRLSRTIWSDAAPAAEAAQPTWRRRIRASSRSLRELLKREGSEMI